MCVLFTENFTSFFFQLHMIYERINYSTKIEFIHLLDRMALKRHTVLYRLSEEFRARAFEWLCLGQMILGFGNMRQSI